MSVPNSCWYAQLSVWLALTRWRRGETPEVAARRELAEEIGLSASTLLPAGFTDTIWDRRRDRVHFFEVRLVELPELQLDNREVIATRLTSPVELQRMALTGLVAAYLARQQAFGCCAGPNVIAARLGSLRPGQQVRDAHRGRARRGRDRNQIERAPACSDSFCLLSRIMASAARRRASVRLSQPV